jgi:hypothetical protein
VEPNDAGSCRVEEGACGSAGVGQPRDFLVPVCSQCTRPSSACTHGASGHVTAVLPMDAKGIQVEIPKLVRPTDSWEVHDPEVTVLRYPVRVSELAEAHFAELSELESLSAPCPRGAPSCGTGWTGLWQTAHVYSLQWSQEVRQHCVACIDCGSLGRLA